MKFFPPPTAIATVCISEISLSVLDTWKSHCMFSFSSCHDWKSINHRNVFIALWFSLMFSAFIEGWCNKGLCEETLQVKLLLKTPPITLFNDPTKFIQFLVFLSFQTSKRFPLLMILFGLFHFTLFKELQTNKQIQ